MWKHQMHQSEAEAEAKDQVSSACKGTARLWQPLAVMPRFQHHSRCKWRTWPAWPRYWQPLQTPGAATSSLLRLFFLL